MNQGAHVLTPGAKCSARPQPRRPFRPRAKHLRLVTLTPDRTGIESTAALYQDALGRIRDVAQGPDGYIYLCTSNRDGRGDPGDEDDLIVRILSPP
jgi:glucose/arabinose dehydrogenase